MGKVEVVDEYEFDVLFEDEANDFLLGVTERD